MIETVVHVKTLEQWKSVLDVWFKHGYEWASMGKHYKEEYFTEDDSNYLVLEHLNIFRCSQHYDTPSKYIEYSQFMAQQKEDNKMETYYVTEEQLDLIKKLKSYKDPLHTLVNRPHEYEVINFGLDDQEEKALLRYMGGDETVEFKVKEPLYRLWAIDNDGDKTYFDNYSLHAPATNDKYSAFTAPLEEIKKWETPAWNIEKAD